jgi:hypothetical protein
MHSKKDILKAFKLMGLSTARRRKPFESLGTPEERDEAKQSYLFIRGDSKSEIVKSETEDARLE